MSVNVDLVVWVDDGIPPNRGAASIDALIRLQELWQASDQGDKVSLKVLENRRQVEAMSDTCTLMQQQVDVLHMIISVDATYQAAAETAVITLLYDRQHQAFQG